MPDKDFYQVSCKVLLKNSKGEILALKADSKGSLAGFHDLPGGRIDDNEFSTPFSEIITRELKEELGDIQITIHPKPVAIGRHLIPAELRSEKKDIHVLYLFFVADYISGDIKTSDEHEGLVWLNLSNIVPEEYFTSGILQGIEMYLKS